MNIAMNKKIKKILVPIVVICIVIGIILISNNYKNNYYSSKVTQADESTKQKDSDKEKENIDKFIDNLNNRKIGECIKLLDDSHINVNYKLDDGQTLYNKALNIALEKSIDIKNMPSDYFPLFDKMNSTADKSLIKFYTDDLNYTQLNFLGCIGINTPKSKSEITASNKNATTSTTKIDNSTKPKSQNFTMDGLELLENSTSKDGRYIQGKIKNNNTFNCSYAEVKAKITDTDGNVLDTPIGNITSLRSGETWSFNIPVIVDTSKPYKYQIINMKCNA